MFKAALRSRRGLRDITNNRASANASAPANGKASFKPSSSQSWKQGDPDEPQDSNPALQNLDTLKISESGASREGDRAAAGLGNRTSSTTGTSGRAQRLDDIDSRDKDNALAVTDYVEDMFSHFREREFHTGVNPDYMRQQPDINEEMRAILVDWLIEVHLKFKLYPETLHLCVNLIDRYLEVKEVSRNRLQLVGVTCLLLASKYEEIYPPELRELVYMTDRAYTKDEVLEMESTILKALHFRLTLPSLQYFLVRYLKAAHADRRMVHMASFICERCLLEYRMLKYLPSTTAAAAIHIAREKVGRRAWSPTLVRYTNYTEEALAPCLTDVRAILESATNLKGLYTKYESSKFSSVALDFTS